MRKCLFIMVLAVYMLLSACGTGENTETVVEESMQAEHSNYQDESVEVDAEENVEEEDTITLEEEGFPIITLRILLPSSAQPQMSVLLQNDVDITKSANQYLRDNNKEYRVRYQTIQMKEEEPTAEELVGADIICARVSPEDAELFYTDIAAELKTGNLGAVYESVPELYWDRVNVNGSIYSMLATPPVSQMMYIGNREELGKLGLDIPEEAIGQGIKNWADYVEKVYTSCGQVGYIMPVGHGDPENPILASNAWSAKFQLVLPFLGIDYESPELGVQSIYESQYAKEMQELWSDWYEKGYFETDGLKMKWHVGLGYDVNVVETEDGQYQYPMQNVTYAAPQVASVSYYASGISKTCEQKDLVYQLLTEMATDDELHEAMTMVQGKEEILWFHLIPKTLLVEKNGQSIYMGSLEENVKLQEERFASAKQAPAPGFIFDTEPVQEEVDALMKTLSAQNFYMQLSAMEISGAVPEYAVEIHYIPQEIIEVLYEQGLQAVLDEANRQLEEYLEQ